VGDMARKLTGYFEKKKYSQEKKDAIVEALRDLWGGRNSDARLRMISSRLKTLLKTTERVELVERLFAKEYARFDRVFRIWRLKDDPNWPKIEQEIVKMQETGLCPFCKTTLVGLEAKTGRKDTYKCFPCNKVFVLKDRK
jgi:hypothetical protein